MHQVLRPRVQVDVLLLRLLLGPQLIQLAPTAVTPAISKPTYDSNSVEHHKLNVGKDSHDEHGLDQRRCDVDVPVLPQVRVLVVDGNELEDGVLQIGIGEEENHSGVDEGCDEDGCHD